MTTTPPGVNYDATGKSFEAAPETILAKDIIAYARATNDNNPRFIDNTNPQSIIASPLFAVKPLYSVLSLVLQDKELALDLLRLVHGEQKLFLHKVLRPGDVVVPGAKITSIQEKSSGHLIEVDQWLSIDGQPAVEARSGLFIRKPRDPNAPSKPRSSAQAQPAPNADDSKTLVHETTQQVDPDQAQRYAPASADMNPIHIDPNVAKAAGLKDCILHGLCTMAFATRAIVDGVLQGDSTRLQNVGVRFASPVYMGDQLTTRIWQLADNSYTFETTNQQDQPVLTSGTAQTRA